MAKFNWSDFLKDKRVQAGGSAVLSTALARALGLGWLPSLGVGAGTGALVYGGRSLYDAAQRRRDNFGYESPDEYVRAVSSGIPTYIPPQTKNESSSEDLDREGMAYDTQMADQEYAAEIARLRAQEEAEEARRLQEEGWETARRYAEGLGLKALQEEEEAALNADKGLSYDYTAQDMQDQQNAEDRAYAAALQAHQESVRKARESIQRWANATPLNVKPRTQEQLIQEAAADEDAIHRKILQREYRNWPRLAKFIYNYL